MSRVWVYQADRFFTAIEVNEINGLAQQFVASWTAHGSALAGKAIVLDNLFVVLEVDEEVAGVTGCSIDKSVHFIRGLGEKFGIDFFDRLRVAYVNADGNLALASRDDFQKLVTAGVVDSDTIVYNNLIQNADELETNWKIPFSQSWHARVF